jgi:hypothetical protein
MKDDKILENKLAKRRDEALLRALKTAPKPLVKFKGKSLTLQ